MFTKNIRKNRWLLYLFTAMVLLLGMSFHHSETRAASSGVKIRSHGKI